MKRLDSDHHQRYNTVPVSTFSYLRSNLQLEEVLISIGVDIVVTCYVMKMYRQRTICRQLNFKLYLFTYMFLYILMLYSKSSSVNLNV